MEKKEQTLEEKIDQFKKDPTLNTAETLFGKENVNSGFYVCKGCGKKVDGSHLMTFETSLLKGNAKAFGFLCEECQREFNKEKLPVIVCLKCHEIITFAKPNKDKKSGFEFKRGNAYHMVDCPSCNPDKYMPKDKKDTPVGPFYTIEEEIYRRINNTAKSLNK